jgi:hypothetical protein
MNMKWKSVLLTVVLGLLSVSAFASEFCDGFRQGYIVAYKQANNTSLTPLVPLCPLKPLRGFGDPKSDYEFGYTIGYRQGIQGG